MGTCSSLNSDPFNLRAEELAMEVCTLGLEVRRTWSEQEMVCSFGGCMLPGTPDGMFECWDGALTCVQVVRVPLVAEMRLEEAQEALLQTVLTKVVKSQAWLSATSVMPTDFVIFCWLPFQIDPVLVERTEASMDRIRALDPRFSLRLRVPADAGALFPALFACNYSVEAQRSKSRSWSEVATFTGSSQENSDDEDSFAPWDITWEWDEDAQKPAEVEEDVECRDKGAGKTKSGSESPDDCSECEWTIAWDSLHIADCAFQRESTSQQATLECKADEAPPAILNFKQPVHFDDGG